MAELRNGFRKKVLEWATERRNHFCIHDLAGYFSDKSQGAISGAVSNLESLGYLIRAGSPSTCKMSGTRPHNFWVVSGKIPEQTKRTRKTRRNGKKKKAGAVQEQRTYRVLITEMTLEDMKKLLF